MARSRKPVKQSDDFAYGIHAVESLLRNAPESILELFIQQKREPRLEKLIALAKQTGISVQSISADRLNQRYHGMRHQGVVARVRPVMQSKLQIEDVLHRDRCFLLVLDGVEDPHNIGACMRTADAAGVDAIIVSRNRSPGITPTVRKVASGAAETVPYIMISNLARTLATLRDDGFWVIGTSGDADRSIYDVLPGEKTVLVMGAEGKGMRRLTRESCDELVSIPMLGSVESLNISVATGICLYRLQSRFHT